MGIKVNIGGDFCVTKTYTSSVLISSELIELFNETDINVINLECPVIEKENNEKIIKTGPHLNTNNEVFQLLRKINISAVTLANNHILDYGTKGLISTLEGCVNNDIKTTGAGQNIKDASEPAIIEKQGIRIALINFCEHEFSIATEQSPGANPLDLIDNIKNIHKARQSADIVFVIIHGGHEHYHLPSPRMIKQYRYFAENGADAVICHHSHCISGYEVHNGIPIFYGLGNFLFTMPFEHNSWYNGLLVQFEIEKGLPIKWSLIPTQQSKDNYILSLCSENDKIKVLEEVNNNSKIISNTKELNDRWISYANSMESQILNEFSPINIIPGRYIRAFIRRLGINRIIFRQGYVIPLLNLIECESLYDLSQYILKTKK